MAVGCKVIRSETISGAFLDDRSELATVMEFLRDGTNLLFIGGVGSGDLPEMY